MPGRTWKGIPLKSSRTFERTPRPDYGLALRRRTFSRASRGRTAPVGHGVLTIQEDGQAGLKWPDSEVLRRATELGRAVLTLNRRDLSGCTIKIQVTLGSSYARKTSISLSHANR